MAAYYSKEVDQIFIIRIAQGLLHMGKGMLTLDPVHSHKLLLNQQGIAGILISIFALIEGESLICGKCQYLLYSLALAVKPRMVFTVDADLKPVKTSVMIGQAIDIAGQTGNPRTISGFQTHTTPALINSGERSEFSNDDFKGVSEVLEDVVIVEEKDREEKK